MARPRYSRVLINFLRALTLLSAVAVVGCSFSFVNIEYKRARKAQENQKFDEAVERYERVVKREPDTELGLNSARQAARIAELDLKNFNKAIAFYEHISTYSPAANERRGALQSIANIALEKKQDFVKAIDVFNKLLAMGLPAEQAVEDRFKLAKAYYYRGDFKQAEMEVDEALRALEKGDLRFEIELFRASILFNTNRQQDAVKIYERLLADYPNLAEKNNVAMSVVVAFEEMQQFDQAIQRLESMRGTYSDEDFLNLKIARLKERRANQPGARGLRK